MPERSLKPRHIRPRAVTLVVALLAASSLGGASGASGAEEPLGKVVGTASAKSVAAATAVPLVVGSGSSDMRPAPVRTAGLESDELARRQGAAAARVAGAEVAVAAARAELAELAADRPMSLADLARASTAMVRGIPLDTAADAQARLDAAIAELDMVVRDRQELDRAVAHWSGLQDALVALRPGAMTIEVLGTSALSPDELASWFSARFRIERTAIAPVTQLAADYIAIGNELGVRGDIAFVQASHETGRFGSGHAKRFNLAGIGAFDSCSPGCGVRFPSLDAGIRGHLALMHDYATAESKLSPLSPKGLAGCCTTWAALAKRWATNPTYAETVLGQYREAVKSAVSGHVIPAS